MSLHKVYVAQNVPTLNLNPAKRFGELQYVLPQGDMSRNLSKTIADIKVALARFEPGDYLLPIGDPLIIGLTLTVAIRYAKGPLKVLRWDRYERDYSVVTIEEI